MYRRGKLPLGGWLLLCLLFFGVGILITLSNTNLLTNGVSVQGVVTGITSVNCGKSGTKDAFSVRFTDRAGQEHTGIISECTYTGFDASVGDSVAIVYLPDDPTQVAPAESLLTNVKLGIVATIFFGIITLLFHYFWIRKRIRNS